MHGSISAGYDYGFIPYISNGTVPAGCFRTEGNMSFQLLSLPFNANFFYSDIKNSIGLNNYFRVVYDETAFRQDVYNKASAQKEEIKNQISSLYSEKQLTEQKLYYLKSLPAIDNNYNLPKNVPPDILANKFNIPQSPNLKHDDKLNGTLNKYGDSLQSKIQDTSILSSVKNNHQDYLSRMKSRKQKADSIHTEIKKYETQINEYETKIKELNTTMENLKDPGNLLKKHSQYLSKTENIFSGVKKLEIGMCYPNYSTFLVSGIAIKGINVEYQKNDFYFAFTHGKTVNNLLLTSNAVQNHLFNMQNLYNFFDFNYVKDSRRITAIKFGYGKKEGNHLYFGLLYGIGLQSYILNTTLTTSSSAAISFPDRNFVSEIDGKYLVSKNSTFDLVYGRSALQTSSQYFANEESGFNSLMFSKQSNAAMGKYSLLVAKTKTKLSAMGRWVDPFFKSYGVGFMRSDNFRCELKAEQPLGKKVKFSGFYRRDEDNLLSLYNYKTILQTIGTNISIKIKRSLSLRLGFNPVIQHVDTKDNIYSARNMNSISNVLVSYNPSVKHASTLFNFMYNYYHLTTGEQTTTFENITVSNLTQFKTSFRNNFTAGWFRANSGDSLNNKTWLFTNELGYTFKNGGTISGGLKAAYNPANSWQYGYLAKAGLPIIRHISFELSAEKLVAGDFYNSLNFIQINKFPYYCSGKLTVSW